MVLIYREKTLSSPRTIGLSWQLKKINTKIRNKENNNINENTNKKIKKIHHTIKNNITKNIKKTINLSSIFIWIILFILDSIPFILSK